MASDVETRAEFLTSLFFEDAGGFPFILTEDLVYRSKVLGRKIVVPRGFKTDLASIPRVLWAVLPPVGKYDAAAVVHDYLYQCNGVTRGQADAVLREAMEVLRVRFTQRWTIYLGVRAGGWKPWNEYRKKEE